MEVESDQVKRLLDLAAAMSSAQAKETGNSKLDMGGIMAVLALAKQEEELENNKSFLHGGYNGVKSGYNITSHDTRVSASSVKTVQSETTNDVKTVRKEGNRSFLHQHSMEMLREETVEETKLEINNFDNSKSKQSQYKLENKNVQKIGTDDRSASKNYLNRSPKPFQKHVIEEESTSEGTTNDDNQVSKNDKKFGSNVVGRKAMFETANAQNSGISSTNQSNKVNKFSELRTNEVSNGNSQATTRIVNTQGRNLSSSTGYTGSAAIAALISQKREEEESQGIAQDNFAKKNCSYTDKPCDTDIKSSPSQLRDIRNKFENRNEESKNSKLMGTKTFPHPENSEDEVRVRSEMKINVSGKTSSNRLQKRLTQLLDPKDVEVARFLATISNMSSEQEEKTGNGKLDMKGILAAISSVKGNDQWENEVNQKIAKKVMESKQASKKLSTDETNLQNGPIENKSKPYEENQTLVNKTSKMVSESKTGLSSRSDILTTNTWSEALHGAKVSTGVSKSSRENNPRVGTVQCQDVKSQDNNISSEKQSVVGELKNIFGGSDKKVPSEIEKKTKGYQLPTMTPLDPKDIKPENPAVKRIVYNQYREMLKSYSVSSQSQ